MRGVEEIQEYQLRQLKSYSKPYLWVSQVVRVLDVSETYVRDLIKDKLLTAFQRKKGCRYLVLKTSLEEFIRTQEFEF